MSKHTPGPWMVAPRIGRYQVTPASERERHQLASINALEFDALSVGTSNGQVAMIPLDESNRANANLIAAAPDLLRALEDLFDQMRRPPNAGEYHRLDLNPSIAAIAKAKGQSK